MHPNTRQIVNLFFAVFILLFAFFLPSAKSETILLSTDFSTDSHEFTYKDDVFRNTSQPAYAQGNYSQVDGSSSGALHIALGGVDTRDILTGMSGGWFRNFNVPAIGTVSITFRYRLVHSAEFDPDECSQVLMALDDELITSQGIDYIEAYCGVKGSTAPIDSGWLQTTITAPLTAGSHKLTVGAYLNQKTTSREIVDIYFDDIKISLQSAVTDAVEQQCSDGQDNDGDGLADCADSDCAANTSCSNATYVVSENFSNAEHGFTYSDDTFRNTNRPFYANGNYQDKDGFSGGGLCITLGGIDHTDILDGISGGWSRNFTLSAEGSINITLRYRLVHYGDFDPDECSQILVAFDDQLITQQGVDYIEATCGPEKGNATQDTGWQQATVTVSAKAGNHTLTVGGYLNQKTTSIEVTNLFFDEINISAPSTNSEDNNSDNDDYQPSMESNCSDGIDNDADNQIDCDDNDCTTDSACQTPTDSDNTDNDDQANDTNNDCSNDASCSESTVILAEDFNNINHGFNYLDDIFRNTQNPIYADGIYKNVAEESDGNLLVTLGGVDRSDIFNGISGGWSQNFTLAAETSINIALNYRQVHYGDFEPEECSQALVAVDGELLNQQNGGFLEEYCGLGDGNPTQDTGWRQFNETVVLSAGSHTLTMGGYLNQKTTTNELASLYFDDIVITNAGDTVSVKLSWASVDASIDGYRVFMCSQDQSYDYQTPIWQGADTHCTISGLKSDKVYYFVVRAYKGKRESVDSNEARFPIQTEK
ncbi:MAG: fibronectin type III domain-containing protein [Desulfobacteraceae bacterium]|jgi:hypothetical protein